MAEIPDDCGTPPLSFYARLALNSAATWLDSAERQAADMAEVARLWSGQLGVEIDAYEVIRLQIGYELALTRRRPDKTSGWFEIAILAGLAHGMTDSDRRARFEHVLRKRGQSSSADQQSETSDPEPPAADTPAEIADPSTASEGPKIPAEKIVLVEDHAPEAEPRGEAPTAAEVDWEALLDRVTAGESVAQVAAEAGICGKALGGRMGSRRRWGGREASSAPALSGAPDTPAAAPSQDEREDDDDFWTPHLDLTLAELMIKGKNSYLASQKCGCKPADCVSRFKKLLPVRDLALEQALLARLRAEVDEQ